MNALLLYSIANSHAYTPVRGLVEELLMTAPIRKLLLCSAEASNVTSNPLTLLASRLTVQTGDAEALTCRKADPSTPETVNAIKIDATRNRPRVEEYRMASFPTLSKAVHVNPSGETATLNLEPNRLPETGILRPGSM